MGNKEAICTKLFRKRVSELDPSDNGFLDNGSLLKHMLNCPNCSAEYFNLVNQKALGNYLALERKVSSQNQPA